MKGIYVFFFFQRLHKTMRDHSEGNRWAVGSVLSTSRTEIYILSPFFNLFTLCNPYIVNTLSLNKPRNKQRVHYMVFFRVSSLDRKLN